MSSASRATPADRQTRSSRRRLLSPLELFIALIVLVGAFGVYRARRGQTVDGVSIAGDVDDVNFSRDRIVEDTAKRTAVKEAFQHAYSAYERDAFGFDNYHPIGHFGTNLRSAGIGYFIIDCLDSLLLLELDDEYARARDWVEQVSFSVDDRFHAFEVTIRVLGGLLAAHHLSGDPMYIEKARDLADRLMPIFDTPSGIPLSFINLATRQPVPDMDNNGWASLAEAGSLQLELRYLSELTGDRMYWDLAKRALDRILHNRPQHGLANLFLDPQSGSFIPWDIRLGSRGDSYYEYLLKLYIQSGLREERWREAYETAMDGVRSKLVRRSERDRLTYTIELVARVNQQDRRVDYHESAKQDHLVCFLPGLLFLGVTQGDRSSTDPASFTDQQADNWDLGHDLLKTCVATYTQAKTGLSPEIAYFRSARAPGPQPDDGRDWYIDKRQPHAPPPLDARNILRPETVESLFVAYRSTGDQRYRDWAWDIFQAFETHCRLEGGGYASILDVDQVPVTHEDRMETFFLAETLKYLYLIFSAEDVMPLDRHVFTTEAHILPILDIHG